MKRLVWSLSFLLAISALACLVGCKPGSEVSATRTVTEKDFGKTVNLGVGSTLGVVLRETAGSRYRWRCTWSPHPKMKLVREVFIREAPDRPGAGGERHFILRVRQPGRTLVTARHGREAGRTFIIQAR